MIDRGESAPPFQSQGSPVWWLATYGAIAAAIFLLFSAHYVWDPSISSQIMPTRALDLEGTRHWHSEGLPLLVKRLDSPGVPGGDGHAPRYAGISVGDDIGMNVLVAAFDAGDLESTLSGIMRWAVATLMAIYPLLFWTAFGSRAIAVVSPLLLLWGGSFAWSAQYFDVYWVQAWIAALCLPAIVVLLRSPLRPATVLLVLGLAIASGLATLVRNQAGLGVLISIVIACWLMRDVSWMRRVALLGVALVVYMAASAGVGRLVEFVRDQDLARMGAKLEVPAYGHGLWHTAYIGLGWFEESRVRKAPGGELFLKTPVASMLRNPCGIRYLDEAGIDRVRSLDPSVSFLSEDYMLTLKREFFRCVKEHPGSFIVSMFAKFAATVFIATANLFASPLSATYMLITAGLLFARRFRKSAAAGSTGWIWLILAGPSMAVSCLPPLIAAPSPKYALGLSMAIFMLCLLWLCDSIVRQFSGGRRGA